jgi:hypothetical protein
LLGAQGTASSDFANFIDAGRPWRGRAAHPREFVDPCTQQREMLSTGADMSPEPSRLVAMAIIDRCCALGRLISEGLAS